MNFRQLEAYLWVSKLGSFSKTAERLFTTQPAISSRISKLEDELQVELFSRDGARVRLTEAGRALLPSAEQALNAVADLRTQAGAPVEVGGLLRIGVSETIVQTWLPDLLAQLRDDYPNLDVEISVDVTANLRDELVDHALDIAFLMGPLSAYTVQNVDLISFDMIWAMKPKKKIKGPIDIPMEELLSFPILTFARNTRPYAEIDQAFRQHTGQAARLFPSTSLSACQRMAERGVGVGCLPHASIKDELASGKLVEVRSDWNPPPLNFTASFIEDPARPILARVAEMAAEVAAAF